MINSKFIQDLDPECQKLCKKLIDECEKQDIHIIVTSTYRDFEYQNYIYNQGRTTSGIIITNAKPGYSYHNFKLAFDVVPIVNDKAVWNDNNLWNKIGKIGIEIGLTWGGNFKNISDKPHFQLDKIPIEDLRKKYLQIHIK